MTPTTEVIADDAAVPALHHALEARAGETEGGGEIDGEHRVPFGVLHAHEQIVARDAGVVDEDVEPAHRRFGGGDQRLDRGGVAEVAGQHVSALAEFGRERLERVAPRARERHGCALAVQRTGDGAAEAAGRARDQRRFACKIEHRVALVTRGAP